MQSQSYTDELERALGRADADALIERIDAYIEYDASGAGDWPVERVEDFGEIIDCHRDDPDKALAYVVLAASRTDDEGFLGMMGAGPLEDILRDPSPELIERLVAEARKSARFRWLLSIPYQIAIAARAWAAIEKFRVDADAVELPPRH